MFKSGNGCRCIILCTVLVAFLSLIHTMAFSGDLRKAAKAGDVEWVKALIAIGAEVNA